MPRAVTPVVLLPHPHTCDECGSKKLKFGEQKEVYGTNYAKWPMLWYCRDCRASVGCHNGTSHPLGKLANRAIRKLRREAHMVFDTIWGSGLLPRGKAYAFLAMDLGISISACHFSLLSESQLKQSIEWAKNYVAARKVYLEESSSSKFKTDRRYAKQRRKLARKS